jgi:hypothetical protein
MHCSWARHGLRPVSAYSCATSSLFPKVDLVVPPLSGLPRPSRHLLEILEVLFWAVFSDLPTFILEALRKYDVKQSEQADTKKQTCNNAHPDECSNLFQV